MQVQVCSRVSTLWRRALVAVAFVFVAVNETQGQFVYGRAGQSTPPQTLDSGLELFESPQPLERPTTALADRNDFVEWASDKRREDEKRENAAKKKAAAEKAKTNSPNKNKLDAKAGERTTEHGDKEHGDKEHGDKSKSSAEGEVANKNVGSGHQAQPADALELNRAEPKARDIDTRQSLLRRRHSESLPRLDRRQHGDAQSHQPSTQPAEESHGPPLETIVPEFMDGSHRSRPEASPHARPPHPGPHFPLGHRPDGHYPGGHDSGAHHPDGHHSPDHAGPAELHAVIARLEEMGKRMAQEYRDQADEAQRKEILTALEQVVERRVELQHRLREFGIEMHRLDIERCEAELKLHAEAFEAIVETELDSLLH